MSDLRDRIASALERGIAEPAVSPPTARGIADELADAVMGVVDPEIAKRDERIAALQAQAIDLEQRASYLATEAIRLASGGDTPATDGSTDAGEKDTTNAAWLDGYEFALRNLADDAVLTDLARTTGRPVHLRDRDGQVWERVDPDHVTLIATRDREALGMVQRTWIVAQTHGPLAIMPPASERRVEETRCERRDAASHFADVVNNPHVDNTDACPGPKMRDTTEHMFGGPVPHVCYQCHGQNPDCDNCRAPFDGANSRLDWQRIYEHGLADGITTGRRQMREAAAQIIDDNMLGAAKRIRALPDTPKETP